MVTGSEGGLSRRAEGKSESYLVDLGCSDYNSLAHWLADSNSESYCALIQRCHAAPCFLSLCRIHRGPLRTNAGGTLQRNDFNLRPQRWSSVYPDLSRFLISSSMRLIIFIYPLRPNA